MKKSRFTEEQISFTLKQAETGTPVKEVIRKMGIDDIDISSIFIPSLTTIRYPVKEMVDEASRILLNRIKQPVFKKNKEIVIKPELIIRESTSAIHTT
jgi:putative transposase